MEQILIKNYGLFESPDFQLLMDSLVNRSGTASLQDIFNKTGYDHSRFIRAQEMNKNLGVGVGAKSSG